MIPKFIDKSKVPHKSGIYIYKNSKGEVIYVGKAVDLFSRVSSYFNQTPSSPKTQSLVSNIADIETIIVESELEALILEANLIKKYLPLYNIRLTDDKDYLYIAITKEDFPRVITARKKDLPAGRHGLKLLKHWFGPFPSAKTVKQTLKQLRRVFPWCSNPLGSRNKSKRACFYYHIKQCPGACVGLISKEDYNKIINRFSKFLNGKKEELVSELEEEMADLAKAQKFENAARVKRILSGIYYLTQPNRVANYLENPNYLEDERTEALVALQKDLNLPELPERIEAYDISNIQGKEATGSMVVLTNGEIDKSQCRRFKIKITGKPNDYAMHAEMMGRRLNHPEWPYPQLFLIDGGRGQVKAVREVIVAFYKSLNVIARSQNDEAIQLEQDRHAHARDDRNAIPPKEGIQEQDGSPVRPAGGRIESGMTAVSNIPIYGLAKRMEWLYPPEGEVLKLPKRSLSLRLLQKIRDESHRFAITYHRKLRKKALGV